MTTKEEKIVSQLLDCGMFDLSVLFDMDEDVALEAIENIRNEDMQLSLGNVVEEAFKIAIDLFAESLPKDVVIESLKDEIANLTEDLDDPDNNEERQNWIDERLSKLEVAVKEIEKLDPQSDFEMYFNFLDTHVSITDHEDVYREYFVGDLEDLEARIGLDI